MMVLCVVKNRGLSLLLSCSFPVRLLVPMVVSP